MSYLRAIAKNTAIQGLSRALSAVLGIVAVGMMTRTLGQSGFGAYTTAVSFLQIFGILVDMGLMLTLVAMLSEPGADEPRIANGILTLRFLSATAFLGLAALVVIPFPYPPEVKLAVAIGTLAFLGSAMIGSLTGIFQRHLRMDLAALGELVGRAALIAGLALTFKFTHSLWAVMLVAGLANAVAVALLAYSARRFLRLRFRIDLPLWREVARRSLPIGISIALNLIYLRGDVFLLSLLRSQHEVGLYGASYRVLDILTMLPTMFMGLVLPALTRAFAADERDNLRRYLQRSFDFLILLALPITLGGFALGTQIMKTVAGPAFVLSGAILNVLIWGVPGIFLGTLYGHAIVALRRQRVMIWGYGSVAVAAVALYLFAIPRFGVWGAAQVTIATETTIAVITFLLVSRTIRALPKLHLAGKALLAALGMTVFLLALKPETSIALSIPLGGLCYIALLALMKAVPKDMLQVALGLKKT